MGLVLCVCMCVCLLQCECVSPWRYVPVWNVGIALVCITVVTVNMEGGTATLGIPKLSTLLSMFLGSWACAGSNSGPRMILHWKIKFMSPHSSWDMPCHLQWPLITEVLHFEGRVSSREIPTRETCSPSAPPR